VLTHVLSYLLIAAFLVLQRVLRRGEQARSLRPSPQDQGTTRLLGMAFGLCLLALLVAPLLNHFGVAHLDPGFPVGWVGVALMPVGLAVRWWANAALGRFYTSTLCLAEDQRVVQGGRTAWCVTRAIAGCSCSGRGPGWPPRTGWWPAPPSP
jgi:hypothetical protein